MNIIQQILKCLTRLNLELQPAMLLMKIHNHKIILQVNILYTKIIYILT